MSKKRRREPISVDARAVEIYEDLANENEEIRLKAAEALLLKVSPETSPSSEELEKVLKRLIRGLCSGRKAARIGFSIALTELLAQYSHLQRLPSSHVITVLEQQTVASGGLSGQEERDHYLGRLFGAEAIIKSEVLFLTDGSSEDWNLILDLIFELALKKTWLREECGWVLYTAIGSLNVASPKYVQDLVNKLQSRGLSKTPEGVALWIAASSTYPGIHLPQDIWHGGSPLDRKERANLAKILKESSSQDEPRNAQEKRINRGSWTPRLHYCWDVVFATLLKDEFPYVRFKEFWSEAVDNGLFAASASDERKYWGFLLFQKYVQTLPATSLKVLFGTNFLRCLTNQLASSERYLNRLAEKSLKFIYSRVELEPQIAGIVVEKLIRLPLDILRKTKIIDKLLAQSDPTALEKTVHELKCFMNRPGTTDAKLAAATRQYTADLLLAIIRSTHLTAERDTTSVHIRTVIIKVLLENAYFASSSGEKDMRILSESPEPPLSDATREVLKSRLTSSLTHLISASGDPALYPYIATDSLMHWEDCNPAKSLLAAMDSTGVVRESVRKSWKTVSRIVKEGNSADEARRRYLNAFKLLFSLTILQVYNGDSDAVGIMDELQICYKTLVKPSVKGQDDEGSGVLVEIILSLVSRPSLLFKRLAQQVFSVCTPVISQAGLASMIKVLETRENASGQQEVFDETDDNEIGIEAIDEDTSDVEMVDPKDNALNSPLNIDRQKQIDSDLEDSLSNEEDDEDSANESDAELALFDAKLAQALGTRSLDDDMAADDGESSDEDMDDDQMEALDAQLETVFRERKKVTSKRNEKKDAKENVVLFKSRVLELLEIYIKHQHLNPLTLSLILPLLATIRTTSSKQVSEKACNLIREYSRLYRLKDQTQQSVLKEARDVLVDVHNAVQKEGSNAYGTACSQASLLAAKMIITNEGSVKEILDQYKDSELRCIENPSSHVKTKFFLDWLTWWSSARKSLPTLKKEDST